MFLTESAEAIGAKSIGGKPPLIRHRPIVTMFERSDIEDFFHLFAARLRRFRADVAERWKAWGLQTVDDMVFVLV